MKLEPIYRVKSDRETSIQYITAYIWNLDGNDDCMYKAAKETHM